MRFGFVLVCSAVMVLAACSRERRQLRDEPAQRAIFTAARESELMPGGPLPQVDIRSPYEGNAYAISEGQRLFDWYNCSGCHAHGGGAIGPPLMGKTLTYGNAPANIFDTIVKGRPHGMPSWGGRIPEYQIWELVAYVRSLGENEPKSATPARTDDIEKKTAAQLQ